MGVKKVFYCSICGAERREANHWFTGLVAHARQTLVFRTWQRAQEANTLEEEHTLHLCGQGCAHKLLDSFLAEKEEPCS